MGKIVKSNLGYLGVDFQYRLISAFFEHPNFFKDLSSIIDQNMFTDAYLRTIVGTMKEYYQKRDSVPSYQLLSNLLATKIYTDDDKQCYDEILEKLMNTTSEGVDEIEEMAERFFKQQNLVRVANEIKKIAGDGDMARYDECRQLVEDAISVSRKTDDCVSPLEDMDDVLSPTSVVTIPTGVDKLDECLGGGLDKGKLGLIIAGSGVGKTSMTTCFAANAAIAGYKVLQIVFEDSTRDMRRKYASFMSDIETCDINRDEETTKEVKRRIKAYEYKEALDNNIRIERLRPQKVTIEGIRALIKKRINEGFKPDMVVIDYFGCIKLTPRNGASKWEIEEEGMREFEVIAPDLDIAIWLPVQGNRESFNADTVEMHNVGGSIAKVQIAQVVISITKSQEDAKNKRATITVLKNRGGRAATQLSSLVFNNGTCHITSDDSIDFDDEDDRYFR